MRRTVMMGALLVLLFGIVSTGAENEPLQGFTRTSSAAERDWEAKFRALPSSIKVEVKKKHLSRGRNFSCFAAHLIERDLF